MGTWQQYSILHISLGAIPSLVVAIATATSLPGIPAKGMQTGRRHAVVVIGGCHILWMCCECWQHDYHDIMLPT